MNAQEMFPNASKSTVAANPQIFAPGTLGDVLLQKEPKNALQGNLVRGKGHQMNKTEAEYALILEAMKRKGEILRYEYEGITLRWAGIRYTPDFVVFSAPMSDIPTSIWTPIKLIEVKGAWTKGKFERAVERFRHARTYWPEFSFEMHQKKKGQWKQIL